MNFHKQARGFILISLSKNTEKPEHVLQHIIFLQTHL